MNDIEFFSLLDVSREDYDMYMKIMVDVFLMTQQKYLDSHTKIFSEPIRENITEFLSIALEKAIKIMREENDIATKRAVDETMREIGT